MKKVKFQYYFLSTIMLIVCIIGLLFYFFNYYIGLFICLFIEIILLLVWRFWGKYISNKYFNGKNVSKSDIDNL